MNTNIQQLSIDAFYGIDNNDVDGCGAETKDTDLVKTSIIRSMDDLMVGWDFYQCINCIKNYIYYIIIGCKCVRVFLFFFFSFHFVLYLFIVPFGCIKIFL